MLGVWQRLVSDGTAGELLNKLIYVRLNLQHRLLENVALVTLLSDGKRS